MELQAYDGYYENGHFYSAGRTINIKGRRRAIITLFDEPVADTEPQKQARKELGEVFRAMQEQSVINGTDKITMDEINEEIAAYRREKRAAK
jgi:hypothetical protein